MFLYHSIISIIILGLLNRSCSLPLPKTSSDQVPSTSDQNLNGGDLLGLSSFDVQPNLALNQFLGTAADGKKLSESDMAEYNDLIAESNRFWEQFVNGTPGDGGLEDLGDEESDDCSDPTSENEDGSSSSIDTNQSTPSPAPAITKGVSKTGEINKDDGHSKKVQDQPQPQRVETGVVNSDQSKKIVEDPNKKSEEQEQAEARKARQAQAQELADKEKAEEDARKADEQAKKDAQEFRQDDQAKKSAEAEAEKQKEAQKQAERERKEAEASKAAEQAKEQERKEAEARKAAEQAKEQEDSRKAAAGSGNKTPPASGGDGSDSGSSSTSPAKSDTKSGDATFYATGLGSCGITDNDSNFICAVSKHLYDSFPDNGNPNNNPVCGKKIKASYNGKSVILTVHDRCENCKVHDLDMSPTAFEQLGSKDEGRLHGMTWDFIS